MPSGSLLQRDTSSTDSASPHRKLSNRDLLLHGEGLCTYEMQSTAVFLGLRLLSRKIVLYQPIS
jgi:hypothetical protein